MTEKVDYRFLNHEILTSAVPRRIVGTSAEITAGTATHTIANFWDIPPSTKTILMFKTNSVDITLTGAEDINVNDMFVYSEDPNAVLDTDIYTLTFSGDNITADIFVSDVNNVIVTGAGCRVNLNGGDVEIVKSLLDDSVIGMLTTFELNENISQNYPVKIIDDSGAKIEESIVLSIIEDKPITDSFGIVSHNLRSIYDPDNNKIFISHLNILTNVSNGVVATVSGNTITYGTPIVYSALGRYTSLCYDTLNNKIVEFHSSTNTDSYINVIEISGNTFTVGPENHWSATISAYISSCFDSNSNRIAIVYRHSATTWSRVVTVAGNTTTLGPEISFNGGSYYSHCCFDSNTNKIVALYVDNAGTNEVRVKIGTISGNTITYGSNIVIGTSDGYDDHVGCVFDATTNKIILTYRKDTGEGCALVGTVSGDTITLGPITEFGSDASRLGVYLDHINDVIYFSWVEDSGDYPVNVTTATITGNTLTFSGSIYNPDNVDNSTTTLSPIVYDVLNDVNVLSWRVENSPNEGHSQVIYLGDVHNSDEYESTTGVLKETGTTGETKPVGLIGDTIDGFTGQTPGAIAYIQYEGGAISEVETPYPIGRFISATELLITKNP